MRVYFPVFPYFENTTEVIFPQGTSYDVNTEELIPPLKKWVFLGSCTRLGCTQSCMYDLFFVRVFYGSTLHIPSFSETRSPWTV
jgi:hypothetical protein